MSSCLNNKKPEINYPCLWQYKVIGTDIDELISSIKSIIGDIDHTLNESKKSSKGKYLSVNLELEVDSEKMRNSIFGKLQRHSSIKMVI